MSAVAEITKGNLKVLKNASMGEQLKGFVVKDNDNALPNLDAIQSVVSAKDVEKKKAEAAKRGEWVKKAAEIVRNLSEKIAALESIVGDGGILSASDRKELEDIKKKREEILLAGDEEVRKQLEFAMFHLDIRYVAPTALNAKSFLDYLVGKLKRWRLATAEEISACSREKKWPEGTLFFSGKVYFAEAMTPANRALAITMAKFLKAVREAEKKISAEDEQKMAEIAKSGDQNTERFCSGETGTYVLVFTGAKESQGVGIIKLRQKKQHDDGSILVIEAFDGAGTLGWLGQNKGRWIPFSWFKSRRIPDHIDGEIYEFAARMVKMLGAALMAYRARQEES